MSLTSNQPHVTYEQHLVKKKKLGLRGFRSDLLTSFCSCVDLPAVLAFCVFEQ